MTAAKKMTQPRRKSESVTPEAKAGASEKAEKAEKTFDFGDFAKSNQETVQTMLAANQAMLDGWTALNREIMAFADHRLREEFGRTESLIGCSGPEEALRLQASFVQAAGEDYLREAQKLMGMMMDISRDCWAPVEERTREAMKAFGQP
ncbi:MAG: phasin family protein [Kiloniellales bacterium]|nr:phasin family protein [Kiloniellales bacterium]